MAAGAFGFGNDLEAASRRLYPQLGDAIDTVRHVVPGLSMSGTGAALFAAFGSRPEAEAALRAVSELGYPAWVCRPVAAAA